MLLSRWLEYTLLRTAGGVPGPQLTVSLQREQQARRWGVTDAALAATGEVWTFGDYERLPLVKHTPLRAHGGRRWLRGGYPGTTWRGLAR